MDSLTIYFLPAILALGIITSYEDIKEGRIRNKYVVAALVLSTAIHAALIIAGTINWLYLLNMLINISFAILVGFVMWHFNIWSAGDAKLYVAFVALLPLTAYRFSTTIIPTGDYIINTFLLAFIFMITAALVKTSAKEKKEAVIGSFRPKDIGISILTIFAIGWLTKYIFIYTNIKQEYILSIALIVIIFIVLQKILKEQTIYFLVLLSLIRLVVNRGELVDKTFLIRFVITLAGFIIVMKTLQELAKDRPKRVNMYKLKPGMVLLESFDRNGLRVKLDRAVFVPYKGRLTKKMIDDIKKIHMKGKLHFNSLEVIERTALAPHLSAGAILTLLMQGNIIQFIIRLAS